MKTYIELQPKYSTHLGTDPEVFATRIAGKVSQRVAVVGSDQIVPENAGTNISRDGVQIELHAGGAGCTCRQGLADSISVAMRVLNNAVSDARELRKDPSIAVSFAPLFTLSSWDMRELSPAARELNCKPSRNAYGRDPVMRDGNIYRIRSASGHLHLGTPIFKMIDPNDGVKLLDLFVGIPCVLVDQDPAQRIRRKTYGRAGEYRLPKHGLEYRVPSNFWLKDYKLQSFVFGMAKLGMRICEGYMKHAHPSTIWAKDLLLEKTDFAEVERVINQNDVDGALRIYVTSIKPLTDHLYGYMGLGEGLNAPFEYFVDQIQAKGLKHWFDLDDKRVLDRWVNLHRSVGWERFLQEVVTPQMKKAKFIMDSSKVTVTSGSVKRRNASVIRAEEAALPLAA